MKISMNTPDHLVIVHRPWFSAMALLIFTAVFGAIAAYLMQQGISGAALFLLGPALGVLFLLVFLRQTRVVFSRIEGTVEAERRALLSRQVQSMRLDQIEKVALQQTRSGTGPAYRVVLLGSKDSPQRRLPLADHYTASRSPSNVAQAINDWLAPREPAPPETTSKLDSARPQV